MSSDSDAGAIDRGEGALERAGPEEHRGVLGQPAEGRSGREAEEADLEHAAAAEVVREPAAQEEQGAEDERVGRQHPLAVGHRDVRARWAEGSATITTEVSRTIMSCAIAIRHERPALAPGLRRPAAPLAWTSVAAIR